MDAETWAHLCGDESQKARPALRDALRRGDVAGAWSIFVDAAEVAMQILADGSPDGRDFSKGRGLEPRFEVKHVIAAARGPDRGADTGAEIFLAKAQRKAAQLSLKLAHIEARAASGSEASQQHNRDARGLWKKSCEG